MRHKLVSLLYIKVLSLSLAVFFLSAVQAQQSQFDFRKTSWGMTKDQVKENESSTLDRDTGSTLWYTSKVANMDTYILYNFIDNKLAEAGYSFKVVDPYSPEGLKARAETTGLPGVKVREGAKVLGKIVERIKPIDDYEVIKEALIQKYSTPTRDVTRWRNERYKDDRSEWEHAVSVGHLSFFSGWDTDTTYIQLTLVGDNGEVNLVVFYSSKQYSSLFEKARREKARQEKIQSEL